MHLKNNCEKEGCEKRAIAVFEFAPSHPWNKCGKVDFKYLCTEHAKEAHSLEPITVFVKGNFFQRASIFGLSLESKPFLIDSDDPEYAAEVNRVFSDDHTLSVDDEHYDIEKDLETMKPEEVEFIDLYLKLFDDVLVEKQSFFEEFYHRFMSWWNKKKYITIVNKARYIGLDVPQMPLYNQVQYLKALRNTSYIRLPRRYSATFEVELDQDLKAFS